MRKNNVNYDHGPFFKIISSNLSKIKINNFQILVFYTPRDIDSLFQNFPDFKQNSIKLAVFGESTLKRAREIGLEVDIKAPSTEFPSMSMALDSFLKKTKF